MNKALLLSLMTIGLTHLHAWAYAPQKANVTCSYLGSKDCLNLATAQLNAIVQDKANILDELAVINATALLNPTQQIQLSQDVNSFLAAEEGKLNATIVNEKAIINQTYYQALIDAETEQYGVLKDQLNSLNQALITDFENDIQTYHRDKETFISTFMLSEGGENQNLLNLNSLLGNIVTNQLSAASVTNEENRLKYLQQNGRQYIVFSTTCDSSSLSEQEFQQCYASQYLTFQTNGQNFVNTSYANIPDPVDLKSNETQLNAFLDLIHSNSWGDLNLKESFSSLVFSSLRGVDKTAIINNFNTIENTISTETRLLDSLHQSVG